jgi:hypothetical protein
MTLEPAFGDGTDETAAGGQVDVGGRGMLLEEIISHLSSISAEVLNRPNGEQYKIQAPHYAEVKALDPQAAAYVPSAYENASSKASSPAVKDSEIQQQSRYNKSTNERSHEFNSKSST